MPRLSLRNKLLLLAVVLALLPIGIAGRTLIEITQGELKALANQEAVLTAEQVARELDGLVADTWLPALVVLRDTFDDPQLGEREKTAVLASSRDIPDVVALQVTPTDGGEPLLLTQGEFAERLAGAGQDPIAALRLPTEKVAALYSSDGPGVGDLVHLAASDDWLLTLVLPLENAVRGRPAALSARVDLRRLRQRVETHHFQATGALTLVDAEGRALFDAARPDLRERELVKAAVDQLAQGARTAGAMPYVRPDGERVLGAYALPRRLDWAVIAERSEATAYVAIRRMTQSLMLWVGIGVVVAVVGGAWFARRISRPILEVGRVANAVGEGDFAVRVPKVATGDEIEDLAHRINGMIEGLAERERVKNENAVLLDLTQRLHALNEQKNKFLGMAAHDLRNPIGGILGYSELLLEEPLDEETATVVRKIQSSSQFMLRLLNDLLDLSQIESGKLELRKEPTDLEALVTQNVELNRILAHKKRITIDLRSEPGLPPLEIDPAKVEQVLSNLISNAVKYSHPDTTVTVTVERREGDVLVAVRDQGQGIPAEELHKVFQEFQKTSVQSTAGEKSTGLGLAIVQKIVDGHGGRIGVESEVGRGSTFSFTLPVQAPRGGGPVDRAQRVDARAPIHFAAQGDDGRSQAGLGTALEVSASGTQIESSVALKVGESIRFTLRLPSGSVTGAGRVMRIAGPGRYGVRFAKLEDDGGALARFLATP